MNYNVTTPPPPPIGIIEPDSYVIPLGVHGVVMDEELYASMTEDETGVKTFNLFGRQRVREIASRPWRGEEVPDRGFCGMPANGAQFLRAVVLNDLDTVASLIRDAVESHPERGEEALLALVNVRNAEGECAMALAAKMGCMCMVSLLLDSGADADLLSIIGTTPLHEACHERQDLTAAQLLSANANPHTLIRSKERMTDLNALFVAVRRNAVDCVQLLLQRDASLGQTRTKAGEPPFVYAGMYENLEALEELARCGVDVDAADAKGTTALHNMVYSGSLKGVRKCLELGCSVDVRTVQGHTPVFIVCSTGNMQFLDLLCAKGPMPEMLNVADAEGRRPFHIAYAQGHIDAAAYLLSKGARAGCDGPCTKCRLWRKQAQRRLARQEAARSRWEDKKREQRRARLMMDLQHDEERSAQDGATAGEAPAGLAGAGESTRGAVSSAQDGAGESTRGAVLGFDAFIADLRRAEAEEAAPAPTDGTSAREAPSMPKTAPSVPKTAPSMDLCGDADDDIDAIVACIEGTGAGLGVGEQPPTHKASTPRGGKKAKGRKK